MRGTFAGIEEALGRFSTVWRQIVDKAHPLTRRTGDGRHLGCVEHGFSSRRLVGNGPPGQPGAHARRRVERAGLGSSKSTPLLKDDQAPRHEVSGPIGPGQSFRREQSRRKRPSCGQPRAAPDPKPPGCTLPREGKGVRSVLERSRLVLEQERPGSPPIQRSCLWIVSIAEVDERRLASETHGR